MNIITTADECRFAVNGTEYSQKQLEAIVNAAWILCCAYERANEENGGGGSVSWEQVNEANALAREGFGPEAEDELRNDARTFNNDHSEDEGETYSPALSFKALAPTLGVAPLLGITPVVEFKRPDDTEGGSCD